MPRAGYTATINRGHINVTWNLSNYISDGKPVYLHGEDYHELFENNDIRLVEQDWRRIGPNPASESDTSKFSWDFNTTLKEYPAKFCQIIIKDDDLNALFRNKDEMIGLVQSSRENFLAKMVSRFPAMRDIGATHLESPMLRKIFSLIYSSNCLISLNEIEDTILTLIILNSVYNARNKSTIILGPSRYKSYASGKRIPRPLIGEANLIKLYAKTLGSSVADSTRHFEQWVPLIDNPAVIRNGHKNKRYLTRTHAENFINWSPDKIDETTVPEQLPGSLNVKVANGKLFASETRSSLLTPEPIVRASIKHLIDQIGDIEDSTYLDNWSQGAKNKLARLKKGLQELHGVEAFTDDTVMQVALDGESFRAIFDAAKCELSEKTIAEFRPLLVHMNVVFSQFNAWNSLKQYAASISWGQEFPDSYRKALSDVAMEINAFPNSVADTKIREAMSDVSSKISKGNAVDYVNATISVRNVLSGIWKYLLNIGKTVGKSSTKAITDELSTRSSDAIHNLAMNMQDKLIELAKQRPDIFGWLTHVITLFQK